MSLDMSLGRRLLRFTLIGAGVGAAISLIAAARVAVFLVGHDVPAATLALLLILYPVAGALGGMLVAITFPLARWLGGAFVVGVLALFPVYLGVALLDDRRLGKEQLAVAAACAIFAGGGLGAVKWFEESRRSYKLAHFWLFAAVSTIVAWFMGLHWAGRWPAIIAFFLFIIPLAFALLATFARSST